MKREDLRAMGLSDEQVNNIMAINGQDIENAKQTASATEKARADGLLEQLNTLTNDLAEARNNAASTKDLKAKLDAAEAKIKAGNKANAIRDSLSAYNPKDASVIMKLLDMDKINHAEDGSITGLQEQIEPLKQNSGFLFSDTPDSHGGSANSGTAGKTFDMNAFLRG